MNWKTVLWVVVVFVLGAAFGSKVPGLSTLSNKVASL